ncbi:MAG: hypothetical protein KDJ29_04145 [Hyphomicrobiales bacterium]|nr:hypothetical protein [Hyphomicrobiales bacterium]
MRTINVLGIQRLSTEDARRIEAVDPRIRYTDACDRFDGEIREIWRIVVREKPVSTVSHADPGGAFAARLHAG